MINVFGILILLACLSPVLTLVRLWQMKEWRKDRLLEHLSQEGFIGQLYGSLRLKILAAAIVIGLFDIVRQDPVFALTQTSIELLAVLGILSCAQILLRRQPIPRFTAKAMLIVGLSMVLSLAPLIVPHDLLPLAAVISAFLCPLWITLACAVLQPIDAFLKARILRCARTLRLMHDGLTVIGITGSVGKTTTKELLACILQSREAIATPVHVNTEIGVAMWLTNVLKDKPAHYTKILIVEMGAYRKGEIKLLTEIARPKYGIITFIGSQHLSLFGSRNAILEAKSELFQALPPDGKAFMNHDNEASSPLRALCSCPVTSVGTDGKADLSALDIEETGNGIRFLVSGVPFLVPVAGTHTVANILLAIAVAQELGMSLKDIAAALRQFKSVSGTFEVKTIRGLTVLDDTYNSSPDSFRAAMAWAKEQPHSKKILLIDGIIELGASEAPVHAALAKEASDIFDRVIVSSPRFLPYFKENGFSERAILLSATPERVKDGELLVCIGRVPKGAIDDLLPVDQLIMRNIASQ